MKYLCQPRKSLLHFQNHSPALQTTFPVGFQKLYFRWMVPPFFTSLCLLNFLPQSETWLCLPPLKEALSGFPPYEEIVSKQLISFKNNNSNFFSCIQSVFCPLHSTRTTLVRVTNELLLAADTDMFSISTLLDLSLAFDTVDYDVLQESVGFSDLSNWPVAVSFSGTPRVYSGSPLIYHTHATPV